MIQVRHLHKYFGDFIAVKNVSFDVHAGESFALLGPNGSGKTTTLKCIAGLIIPSQGEILLNGAPLALEALELRQQISYLPQRVTFPDDLTALEVLEFYSRLRQLPLKRIDELLAQVPVLAPDDLERYVGEFSVGMKQRLGILVALLPDAPVLLFDEPSVSLDPEGARQFRQLVAELKAQGRTILFSSHVLSEVELLADRVAILLAGELVAVETVESLRQQVADAARMRIVLANPKEEFTRWARLAGVREAVLEDNCLIVTCEPARRLNVLDTLRKAGAQILQFSTEEPQLDEIYARYVRENGNGKGRAVNGSNHHRLLRQQLVGAGRD